ncbi:MAG: hypothetical protein N3D20_01410 [Candidatus Pacearchaeota archaeon]|nr:hypothetical protein [Candidatus Pacearchaeota archaeon]
MNKKGDVPSVIIIVVALALVISALFVFLSFNGSLRVNSEKTDQIMRTIDLGEGYVKSKAKFFAEESIKRNGNIREDFIAISKASEINVVEFGNFFARVRNGEFKFEKNNGKYVLEIKDLFVEEEFDYNRVTRHFDICMEFDEKGNFLENCDIRNK